MLNTVSLGSLRPVKTQEAAQGLSKQQLKAVMTKGLMTHTGKLPRPLARELARLTYRLGMASPATPQSSLQRLNTDLGRLAEKIMALPNYHQLFQQDVTNE